MRKQKKRSPKVTRPHKKKSKDELIPEITDEQFKKEVERAANKKKPEFMGPDPTSQPH